MANMYGNATNISNRATSDSAELAEETEEKGKHDPDKLVPCPYDKNHQIRACRIPYHLLKCRKNHPKLARELKTCPFNARHLVQKHELARHTETCEDRKSVNDGSTDGECKWPVPISTWVNPDMAEDWDKEADDAAPPFVWGENKVLNAGHEIRPSNKIGPGVRIPSTLPWS